MKWIKHPQIDTVLATMSWERACANSKKTHLRRSNAAFGHHDALTTGWKRPQVKRIAVGYASQVPQSNKKAGITHEGFRKSLKVNREIKTHHT